MSMYMTNWGIGHNIKRKLNLAFLNFYHFCNILLKVQKLLISVLNFQCFTIAPLPLGLEVKLDGQMIKRPLYPCKLIKSQNYP
jgi:hypothetical protein